MYALFHNHSVRILALAVILILIFLPYDGLNIILCPMQNLMEIPCPACGITRSLSALLHFHPITSFNYHPLGIIILAAIVFSLIVNRTDFLYRTIFKNISIYHVLVILFIAIWLIRLTLM